MLEAWRAALLRSLQIRYQGTTPADILAKLHIFGGLDEATEKYFNEQFATLTGLG